jgi:O-acetyl-ADP-ribose deacetylase (regulator of RNase III)
MFMSQHGVLEVIQDDITRVKADAIVNAANTLLRAGGGVCGAIFRAAGREKLTAACDAIGGCPTGSAVLTPAFDIATAQYIIHAVGPIYADHNPDGARRLLRSAYTSALQLAFENGCESVAFPAISTGIYGYPWEGPARRRWMCAARRFGAPVWTSSLSPLIPKRPIACVANFPLGCRSSHLGD